MLYDSGTVEVDSMEDSIRFNLKQLFFKKKI
jgi:hypothetical protein